TGCKLVHLTRAGRQGLHQLVQKRLAFVKRLHTHALVPAVEAYVVPIYEKSLYAVARNAGPTEGSAIGGAHHHDRNYGNSRPEFICNLPGGIEDVRTKRR